MDTEENSVVAEEPSSEPTAKNYGFARRNAQHRRNFRWLCGRFEQSDTGESCGVEMAERVGLSSTDLPDARNPINKGFSSTGKIVVYHPCVPLYEAFAKPAGLSLP
jgi:hypothetical protein